MQRVDAHEHVGAVNRIAQPAQISDRVPGDAVVESSLPFGLAAAFEVHADALHAGLCPRWLRFPGQSSAR